MSARVAGFESVMQVENKFNLKMVKMGFQPVSLKEKFPQDLEMRQKDQAQLFD